MIKASLQRVSAQIACTTYRAWSPALHLGLNNHELKGRALPQPHAMSPDLTDTDAKA